MRDAFFMTMPSNPGAGRAISLGEALAYGLAGGVNGFIQTNNTFEQQRQQQANVLADQQFRQAQADEQRRQFEAQQRQARDTQTFQWLNSQQQQLTQILQKGGFAKGSAEYQAAEHALKETNKLMGKVVKGDELTAEEQQGYDTLLGNVGAITGQGAAVLGERAAAQDDAALKATTTQTAAVEGQTRRADELQPFTVAGAGLQNRAAASQVAVAEGTQGAQIARAGLENQGLTLSNEGRALANTAQGQQNAEFAATSPYRQNILKVQSDTAAPMAAAQLAAAEIGVDTARWQLGDMKTKAPAVYESLRLANAGAQQALDFNAEMQPERMTALRQQNEQTRVAIDQSKELFPWQKRALIADVNVKEAQADIVQATKAGTIARTDAENYSALAQQVRDPAAFDELVADGVMTAEQAKPFKALAGYYRDSARAELDRTKAVARTAQSQTRVQERTEGAQVSTAQSQASLAGTQAGVAARTADAAVQTAQANARAATADANVAEGTVNSRVALSGAQAEGAQVANDAARFNLQSAKQLFPIQLKSAQTALDSAQQQLSEARAGQPYRIDILRANVATLQQELRQNAQMFGPKLQAAQLQVQQLASEVRVLEGTEGARISTAGSQAQTAAAQATSAGAQAQVDAATITTMIAARQVSVQQARASLAAQLTENRFADATFADRVKGANIQTQQGVQQLLAMRQQYSQNAAKFPAELKHLNAQVAVAEAQAREIAAQQVGANGGVTDKKSMLTALDAMRKINADERRLAATNLQNTVKRLIPNARFSVDKYDPKSFMAMVGSTAGLTPDQKQELANAQLAYDTAAGKASDLSTAFAQVSGKGRIDPAVAERLGMTTPEEAAAAAGQSSVTAQATVPGTDLTKLGIARDAVYSGRDAKGNPISYCSKFARQLTAQMAGKEAYGKDWSQYFGGDANQTLNNFRRKNALTADRLTPQQAMQYTGQLKEGDLIFLNYGNPAIDHVAVYDGKGGIIQHSLPSFRGQTIQGSVNTMSIEEYLSKSGRAQVSFGRVGGVQQGPAAPAGPRPQAAAAGPKPQAAPKPSSVKPTDVAGTMRAQGQQLTTFYGAVKKAPSAQAATKLLQDKAIQMAGGPNAPQSLKAAYFDALLAEARK